MSTAVVAVEVEQAQRVVSLVEKRGHLASLLASDPQLAERFKTVVLSALTSSPKLMQCDEATLVQAVREAAMWGLEPDGVEAVIVPFWSSRNSRYEADFQPMARGYVTALYRSPRITYVDADVVYEADDFEYEKGATPRLVHRPKWNGERGKRIGAYAVIKLDSGEMRPIVLNEEQIEKRRRVSRESEKGPWVDWEDEMWRKTALRSIISIAPVGRRLKQAAALESAKYEALPAAAPEKQLAPASPVEAARQAFLPPSDAPDQAQAEAGTPPSLASGGPSAGSPEAPAVTAASEDMGTSQAAQGEAVTPPAASPLWSAEEVDEAIEGSAR